MPLIKLVRKYSLTPRILRHLYLWVIRNHDPPEVEPDYIPELTYVKDSDHDNSDSQIPVFDTFWS